ncbi:hypothetical protein MHI12_16700 [Paenibacillus sp. FSL H8-0280]|uniref:hypothetical protein n=1 Tax=Paenibacillus sp. FSL H8-0280 TaxID=2921382 RepID=UPI00324A68DA
MKVFPVSFFLQILLRNKAKRCRFNAITQPARRATHSRIVNTASVAVRTNFVSGVRVTTTSVLVIAALALTACPNSEPTTNLTPTEALSAAEEVADLPKRLKPRGVRTWSSNPVMPSCRTRATLATSTGSTVPPSTVTTRS